MYPVLKGCCLNLQCFLNLFGSHKTLTVILRCFKNIFSFKVVKTNTKKEKLEKPKEEKLLLLIPENTGVRVLSVCKTKIPTEYRKADISCFKN